MANIPSFQDDGIKGRVNAAYVTPILVPHRNAVVNRVPACAVLPQQSMAIRANTRQSRSLFHGQVVFGHVSYKHNDHAVMIPPQNSKSNTFVLQMRHNFLDSDFVGESDASARYDTLLGYSSLGKDEVSTNESLDETSVDGGSGSLSGGASGYGSSGGGGGSGGSGENDWAKSLDPQILALLSKYKQDVAGLPSDLITALKAKIVRPEMMEIYLKSVNGPLGWFVHNVKSYRDRVLCDKDFLFKLMVQEIVGNGTQLAGEIVMRGKDIWEELEYVASDLIVGTVVEAAFVWILTPCIPFPQLMSPASNKFTQMLRDLPANMFESNTALRTYTVPQRIGSFFNVAAQYFAVGVLCGIVGTIITYGLIEARKKLDKNYVQHRPLPPILQNSFGWGFFMAVSSNTRFQLVEGLERGASMLLRDKYDALLKAVIFTLRFGNNYYGGINFVQMFRWMGLHATSEAK